MRLGSVILDGLGKNISFIRSNMFYLTYNTKKRYDIWMYF